MRDAAKHILAPLGPDEAAKPVPRAEIGASAAFVLMHPRRKIGGHADIERAAIAIGHDVHPAALPRAIHGEAMKASGMRGQAVADGVE